MPGNKKKNRKEEKRVKHTIIDYKGHKLNPDMACETTSYYSHREREREVYKALLQSHQYGSKATTRFIYIL